jgi:hypothetical protein
LLRGDIHDGQISRWRLSPHSSFAVIGRFSGELARLGQWRFPGGRDRLRRGRDTVAID